MYLYCMNTLFKIAALILFVFFAMDGVAQHPFVGFWQGMLKYSGQDYDQADVIYIEIDSSVTVQGLTRIEVLNDMDYALKDFTGEIKGSVLKINEQRLRGSSNTRNTPKCKFNFELTYDTVTGYLSGSFLSSDCRGKVGEVVLYRAHKTLNKEKDSDATHYWKYQFVRLYKKGIPAPLILEQAKENFEFQPIYFNHDESEVKAEFHNYLNKMAMILEGIHDLRIKVIGHTDSDGSDEYNIALSKRRAKAIKAYFLARGVSEDKLEIDFKGERKPVDSNTTHEGKQRNRRVDFEFI